MLMIQYWYYLPKLCNSNKSRTCYFIDDQIGLKVNYNKSVAIPINVAQDKGSNILNILDCQLGSFPFTYLGLPLSINRLKNEDFSPMMQRIERRISGCSTLISYDGRLQLIKFVFSSLPILFMTCLAQPMGAVNQINTYLRHCLWRKYDLKMLVVLLLLGTWFVSAKAMVV